MKYISSCGSGKLEDDGYVYDASWFSHRGYYSIMNYPRVWARQVRGKFMDYFMKNVVNFVRNFENWRYEFC